MPADRNRLEFERIRNLIQGFGWEVSKEEITDVFLIMTLTKKRTVSVLGTEGIPSG
jgi:hypothetical protein